MASKIEINYPKVSLYTENRDGKVYVVFQSGNNHICGQLAVGHQGRIPREVGNEPEDLLTFFLENGFQGL